MSESAVQINGMDLLSGIPTILLLVAGIIQIWPSPSQVYQKHIEYFMTWLKTNIERDFCMSIYFCEQKCMTQLYDSSLVMLEKRIHMNIGEVKDVGCLGSGTISTMELVDIVQRNNNGIVLVELAKAVRYPKIKKLTRAIRVLGYSPSFGKRVIFFQWMAVIVSYSFSWLFVNGFPGILAAVFTTVHNVMRRAFGLGPMEPSSPHILQTDEQMAELARHRVISEHIPWVRYGIYYLVANLAGKQLSTRTWKIDETEAKRKDKDSIVFEHGRVKAEFNEHASVFDHVMINERRLIMKMTCDECSAARLFYSIALHSLQAVLLCSAFGYPPPHKLVGSFRRVKLDLNKNFIIFKNARLDSVLEDLYGWTPDRSAKKDTRGLLSHFDSLLQILGSQLFTMVAEPVPTYIPMDLTLLDIDNSYIVSKVETQINGSGFTCTYQIDGIEVSNELFKKLCDAHSKSAKELDGLTEKHLSSRIFWGASTWLLYTLLDFYKYTELASKKGFGAETSVITLLPKANSRLRLLINAPFQARVSHHIKHMAKNMPLNKFLAWSSHFYPRSSDWNIAFKDKECCSTVPMWCVCSKDCRGICTLIVNELNMTMNHVDHKGIPYIFSISPRIVSPLQPSIFVGKTEACRLLCAVDKNQLSSLISEEACFQMLKTPDVTQSKEADSCTHDNKESEFMSGLIGIRSDGYHTYRNSRVSNIRYRLSDALYEDAPHLVVIIGDQILILKPGHDSKGVSMEESFQESLLSFRYEHSDNSAQHIYKEKGLRVFTASILDQIADDIDDGYKKKQDQQSNSHHALQRSVKFDPTSCGVIVTD